MVYALQEVAQVLTLSNQARCLTGLYDPQTGSFGDQTENARFLVGCQSVKANNSQVHLVTVEDRDDCQGFVLKSRSFIHPDGEVLSLSTVPVAPLLFISVYSSISEKTTDLAKGARIWRLPPPSSCGFDSEDEDDDDDEVDELDFADHQPPVVEDSMEQLEFVASLPFDDFSSVKHVTAHPTETSSDLACVLGAPFAGSKYSTASFTRAVSPSSSFLAILKGAEAAEYTISSCSQLRLPCSSSPASEITGSGLSAPVNAIRWSPHRNACTVAVACDSGVLGVDIRCMQPCFWLEDIHWPCVRDLDFNPNRDHTMATAGDDGCVCVWDLRNCGKSPKVAANPGFVFRSGPQPLVTLPHHSHWVWSVRYHPTRDQLLISAGSDSKVCLYGLSSLFSETKDLNATKTASYSSTTSMDCATEGLLAKSDFQHEESVYAVDWSPVDPWIFASVDYDGHFVVNQVPDKVKLGILLQRDDDDDDDDVDEDHVDD